MKRKIDVDIMCDVNELEQAIRKSWSGSRKIFPHRIQKMLSNEARPCPLKRYHGTRRGSGKRGLKFWYLQPVLSIEKTLLNFQAYSWPRTLAQNDPSFELAPILPVWEDKPILFFVRTEENVGYFS